jgi:hypothetical protein
LLRLQQFLLEPSIKFGVCWAVALRRDTWPPKGDSLLSWPALQGNWLECFGCKKDEQVKNEKLF